MNSLPQAFQFHTDIKGKISVSPIKEGQFNYGLLNAFHILEIAGKLKRKNFEKEKDSAIRKYLYRLISQKVSRKKLAKAILLDDFRRAVYLASQRKKLT